MRMINRLLEDASDGKSFVEMLERINADDARAVGTRRFSVVAPEHQGNRAERRARARLERKGNKLVIPR